MMRNLPCVAALLGLGLATIPALAQKPSFDVVSIRPGNPEKQPHFRIENNLFSVDLPVAGFIQYAWDLMLSREQLDAMVARLPKWVSTDTFDVEARAQGNPSKEQMRLMVQAMLAERFHLQVHFETAQVPVLAFVLDRPGKTGPKLRPHSEGPPCDVHLPSETQVPAAKSISVFPPVCEQLAATSAPNHAVLTGARNITIAQIATFVSSVGHLGRPVVDQTGLNGNFDFTLEFNQQSRSAPPPDQDAQPGGDGTTLQEALQEQLGLKLKATTAPLDTLVVDHVERPSDN